MTKRMMPVLLVLLVGGLLLTSTAFTARSPSYDLSWWTVDGGGGALAIEDGYSLSGTAGQPDAGVLTGNNYALSGGFWVGALAVQYRVHLPLVVRNGP